MQKPREIIRLKLQAGQSGRAIARSCGLSPSTVGEYVGRIALAGLTWPLSATMRQAHRAGEKTFIDFSGDGIDVANAFTGECQKAVLFVAVLGASNLTYVEPVLHQDLPTWIGCHVRACEYFGGVSAIWVPDNPKVGVTRADRYDPDLNPTYAELARHYEAAVIPARPRRPRDKAKVEAAVLIAERWILAVLRHRTFYSIEELRTAVAELLAKLNDRPMRRLKMSRRQLLDVNCVSSLTTTTLPHRLSFVTDHSE